MADQPALGSNGKLLDASKIEWYNDPDDPQPIRLGPSSEAQLGTVFQCINSLVATKDFFICTGHRSSTRITAGTRLAAAIAAEKLDEFGNPIPLYFRRPLQTRNSHTTAKRKQTAKSATTDNDQADTDVDDGNFLSDASSGSAGDELDDDANADIMEISNEEVLLSIQTYDSTTHRYSY
jgi:hypothetical protein